MSCILFNVSIKLSSVPHLISARQCFSQVLWMVASDSVNIRAFFWLSMNHCPVMLETDHCCIKSLAKAIWAHTLYQHVPLKEIYHFKAAQSEMMSWKAWAGSLLLQSVDNSSEAAVWMSELQTALGSRGECLISLSLLVVLGFCIFQ